MSLMPDLQLGLWNAWIITAVFYSASLLPLRIGAQKVNQRGEGEPALSELGKAQRNAVLVAQAVVPFTIIFSIFVPLKLGTIWFYAGLLVSIVGAVVCFLAGFSFATAPLDRPMTSSIYSITRNPLYVGAFMAYTGIGLACRSWIFLLCAAIWIVSWNLAVPAEERILISKYGSAYEEYMEATPRWIGWPRRGKGNRDSP